MNYYFTGILIILICLLTLVGPAYPGSTQTNTSGSNTAIEGGYTSTATTTYQSGSESTSTTNNTTNSDIRSSPPSCLPGHQWPDKFNDIYDCMQTGYKQSLKKIKEVGREDVNEYEIFIRFACVEEQSADT